MYFNSETQIRKKKTTRIFIFLRVFLSLFFSYDEQGARKDDRDFLMILVMIAYEDNDFVLASFFFLFVFRLLRCGNNLDKTELGEKGRVVIRQISERGKIEIFFDLLPAFAQVDICKFIVVGEEGKGLSEFLHLD